MVRILLVEDHDAIRRTLTRGLTENGAVVTAVSTAVDAIQALTAERPDAVLPDLGLPDHDGSDVLTMARATSDVSVVSGTARDDEREIVRLLDAGADDYLVKPISAAHAMERVRAVLGRTTSVAADDQRVVVGDLAIDPSARIAAAAGADMTLSRKEFDLLPALAPGRRGRQQARAARRRMGSALGRRRPHRRRPPVLAAPHARGDRRRTALPAQRARRTALGTTPRPEPRRIVSSSS